jgi:ubiquinone/menaquinone biosynthesis C-methylase UbiE
LNGAPASVDDAVSASGIRRFSHSSTNRKLLELTRPWLAPGRRVLDLGAGEGYFAELIGRHVRDALKLEPAAVLSACDAVPAQFRYPDVSCDAVDSSGRLPYGDGTFDVVCSLEVIEHIEDQFGFLREAFRVLKPGGVALVSTPNVLNMNSRWRYLHSGFAQLFNPLQLDSADRVHTSGHIHPVSYYYLAFAMRTAGFEETVVHHDQFKRSAVFQLLLFGLPMLLGRLGFLVRMRRKHRREMDQNRELVATMNSFAMLTSRSVILEGRKPTSAG